MICNPEIFDEAKKHYLKVKDKMLDEDIRSVIRVINEHPSVVTLYCCSGHWDDNYRGYIMFLVRDDEGLQCIHKYFEALEYTASPKLEPSTYEGYNRITLRFAPTPGRTKSKESYYKFLFDTANTCFKKGI